MGSTPRDAARLPKNWQQDPLLRDEVHRQIRSLRHLSQLEIARQVGCSSRHIGAILAR